jgi:hypothetical protein
MDGGGRRGSHPPPSDSLGGRPQCSSDGHPFRRSEGGRLLRPSVAAADGWPTAAKADVREVVRRVTTLGGPAAIPSVPKLWLGVCQTRMFQEFIYLFKNLKKIKVI